MLEVVIVAGRMCSEIPKGTERIHSRLLASFHQLFVSFVIRSNEDDFSIPDLVYFLQDFERIRTAFPRLRVPKDSPFGTKIVVNERGNSGAEGLLHVTSNPDQEPVRGLKACGKGGAKTSSGAYSDTSLVQSGCIRDTSELELTRPDVCWHIIYQTLGEVALDTTDHVMVRRIFAFADGTESVILLDC